MVEEVWPRPELHKYTTNILLMLKGADPPSIEDRVWRLLKMGFVML